MVICWERAELLVNLSHVVSWVRCGIWLNRFLIFAFFLPFLSQIHVINAIYISCNFMHGHSILTLCILENPKGILWQTGKSLGWNAATCGISSGPALFAKINTIFAKINTILMDWNAYLFENFYMWTLKIYNGQSHPYCTYLFGYSCCCNSCISYSRVNSLFKKSYIIV